MNDATTGERIRALLKAIYTRNPFVKYDRYCRCGFQSGVGEIIHRPYEDERFNSQIDEQTGYVTKNIVCAPIMSARRETIGVIQILNKNKGRFRKIDLEILEAICSQAAVSLRMRKVLKRWNGRVIRNSNSLM